MTPEERKDYELDKTEREEGFGSGPPRATVRDLSKEQKARLYNENVKEDNLKNLKLMPTDGNLLDKEIDIIITLSNLAQELCPSFPGKVEQLHWDTPDPFPGWVDDSHFLPKFREVRSNIRGRIETFLQSH